VAAFVLRDYQNECIDAVFAAWKTGVRRPVAVLATGAGKTLIFSDLIRQFRSERGLELDGGKLKRSKTPYSYGPRVLVLAHRDELIDQAIDKLKKVLPYGTRVGKVKAGSNGVRADVIVASVQTLARPARLKGLMDAQGRSGRIGLVISDECHLAGSPKGAHAPSSWMKILDAFDGAHHLGVTATLGRGDGKGLGDVWDKVAYTRSTQQMIEAGFLTPIDVTQIAFDVDLSGVRTRGGDYVESDLGAAVLAADVKHAVANAYVQYAKEKQGVVFTPDIATAEAAASGLNEAGIRAAVVSGATPRPERHRLFKAFENGDIRVLANCQLLTAGWDAPWAEVMVLARHTKSRPLYQQMVGRVLRLHEGKDVAMLLDLTNASSEHNLHPIVDLSKIRPPEAEEDCLDDKCEVCGWCNVCKPCPVCETCLAYGGCDACPECPSRVDRSSCDGCGRCKSSGPGVNVTFATETRKINLFEDLVEESAYAWGRTPAGVPYVSVMGGHVFLWPSGPLDGPETRYTVAYAPEGGKWRRTDHTGLTLDDAMEQGQAVVRDHGGARVAKKNAAWRKQSPSGGQLKMAHRLGIDPIGKTKGELSEAIDARVAEAMFDTHFLAGR
jgi:superfamily II DNA or RNA helicase